MGRSFAQANLPDSASLQIASANFYKAIGQESRLYNGHEYQPYDPQIRNNAFFPYDAKTWAIGEVDYDKITYRGVPMMYDQRPLFLGPVDAEGILSYASYKAGHRQ